ncbi:MAG: hypothetical protein LQ337_004598 [Flavoplaca oasis]|nr:MAG: hypothetical protein LQ337_004598 [Flavoplaca oasis]
MPLQLKGKKAEKPLQKYRNAVPKHHELGQDLKAQDWNVKQPKDLQEIAELNPQSDLGLEIMRMGIDYQLREFTDKWESLIGKLGEQLRLLEADTANTQVEDRESD